jgi:hypothetical protein
MSKIQVPALYQTETFSSGFGQYRPRHETAPQADVFLSQEETRAAPGFAPRRMVPFIVQLTAHGDPNLRKVLGRAEVAQAREQANGFAAAHRGGMTQGANRHKPIDV